MNTHEEYVTYAQAKALKELGFDWPCKAWWESEYGECIFYDGYDLSSPAKYNHQYNQWMFSAPTQAVACRWLREEKEVRIEIVYSFRGKYYYTSNTYDVVACPTYELALSDAIDRALEVLKQS